MKKKEIKLYKWAVDSNARLEDVLQSTAGRLKSKIENDERLTPDDWAWLIHNANFSICCGKGSVSVLGWCFDFRPVLKLYVYKQHGHWEEMYAPNKTLLRKNIFGGSQVKYILEVK